MDVGHGAFRISTVVDECRLPLKWCLELGVLNDI